VLLQKTAFALALSGKFCLGEFSQITRGTFSSEIFCLGQYLITKGIS
jgi:hypothetical protein